MDRDSCLSREGSKQSRLAAGLRGVAVRLFKRDRIDKSNFPKPHLKQKSTVNLDLGFGFLALRRI